MTTAAVSRTRRSRRSILAQTWFPGALGLWFAALLGLSSLVVAPAVLERAVLAVGPDRLFPAAAPPLGETARLLIAVAASALGEIAGLLIGRALARSARARPEPVAIEADAPAADDFEFSARLPEQRARDRHPDAPPRRPLVASEELVLTDAPEAPALSEMHELSPLPEARESFGSSEPSARPIAVAAEPAFERAPLAAPPLSPVAAAPLEDLGPAQLTERLAMALTARKDRGAIPSGLASRLGALAGLEGARLGASDDDASDEEEDYEEEDAVDDSAFSSLLNIGAHYPRNALGDEPEIEDDDPVAPVATFSDHRVAPVDGPQDPDFDETDRALRAALRSPDRFSGTR